MAAGALLLVQLLSLLFQCGSELRDLRGSFFSGTGRAAGFTAKEGQKKNPGDAEACTNEASITIRNTGNEEKDDAKNVQISITAVTNAHLVKEIIYNPIVGDINDNSEKIVAFEIILTDSWNNQKVGTEVKVKIEITNEDNRAEHNIGKLAHYTIIKITLFWFLN